MTALLFTLTILSALVQANSEPQAAVYRISGVVVDALGNVPVARAQVSISRDNEQTSMVAGNDGRFMFEGLAAGKYSLRAAATGYLEEAYNQHGAFSVAIVTGKGQDSEHLTFRLHPQAVISGRVTDEHGEPVRSAQVAVFAADLMRGSQAKLMRAQTQTNDLGEYRFAHLAPDKYYLAVQARPWYAQSRLSAQMGQDSGSLGNGGPFLFVSAPGVDSDPILDVVYPITFYPGVTDERSSASLVLSAGEKEEANITLEAVPATHLRLTGLNSERATSLGVGASQRVFGTFSFGLNEVFGQVAPGEYEVAGLPRGELTLIVTTNKANEWTSRSIEVDSRSQGTMDGAALSATAKVAGRVFLPGANAARGGSLSLTSTSATTLPGVTTRLEEDGTFSFSSMQPGTYRIQVNLPPGDYYVQKVIAKEAKTSGREIVITGGNDADLTVILGHGQGQATGVVQLEGTPAAGVLVLLVPESGQDMEEDSRMDESDSDGTFSLGGILPGDYVLLAIKDGWDLEWSNSDVLRPYLSAGQKISIGANQSVKVTVSAQERTAAMEQKPR
ncbi:MAG TPA: carboxypeptidase regulatory-like domain-containing protein [Candidatus Acidoferrum sp.]